MAFAEFIHKPLKGDKMRFDNRPWMDDLYLDPSDKIVVVKSTKTGVSEWALCDLFCMAQQGFSGMYVLPDEKVRNRFITTRFDILVPRVPEYSRNLKKSRKDVDAKGLKSIYGQNWAFVGSGGKSTFYEFNADCMIYDEYDQCEPRGLVYGEDRTLGADRVMWRKIGNPTVSGFGISKEFEDSDKKFWLTKCEHCGKWDQFDWFVNFVREEDKGLFSLRGFSDGGGDSFPLCRYCDKPRDRLAKGEWVPEHPGKDISGYEVSRLFGFPGNDNPQIIRQIVNETFNTFVEAQGNPMKLQRFHNNILGKTYAGAGAKFSTEILEDCKADYIMPMKASGSYGGADVGAKIHLHIEKVYNGIPRKLFVGSVPDWRELHNMTIRFGMNGGLIDAEPEHHAAKEFVMAHSGWFVCYYNLADTNDEDFLIDYVTQTIRVKRTASLDASMQRYIMSRIQVPRDYKNVDDGDFVSQMCASTRVQETAPSGKVKFVWTKAEDHHQHADNYCRIYNDNCRGGIGITVM